MPGCEIPRQRHSDRRKPSSRATPCPEADVDRDSAPASVVLRRFSQSARLLPKLADSTYSLPTCFPRGMLAAASPLVILDAIVILCFRSRLGRPRFLVSREARPDSSKRRTPRTARVMTREWSPRPLPPTANRRLVAATSASVRGGATLTEHRSRRVELLAHPGRRRPPCGTPRLTAPSPLGSARAVEHPARFLSEPRPFPSHVLASEAGGTCSSRRDARPSGPRSQHFSRVIFCL